MSQAAVLRTQITEQIVEALKQDQVPWRRPWSLSPNAGRPANVVSGKLYSGVNPLLLQLHAMRHGLRSRWYATFEQWKSIGGVVEKRPTHVPPGKWGCQIVFYRPLSKKVRDPETGAEQEQVINLMRTYTVFSVDQVSGGALDEFRAKDDGGTSDLAAGYRAAESLVRATGADIRHGGNEAYYMRPVPEEAWPAHKDGDYIVVPSRSQFLSQGMYFETVLHELAHWSEVRTGWDRKRHGYAAGELVAEMAACFLAAELHIPDGEDLRNHANYLRSWLEAMQADPSFIFKASTQATRVVEFLLQLQAKAGGKTLPSSAA